MPCFGAASESGVRPSPGRMALNGRDEMADDLYLVALRECAAELRTETSGRGHALDLLDEVDALAPGLVEQAAARIQLRRLPRTTAH